MYFESSLESHQIKIQGLNFSVSYKPDNYIILLISMKSTNHETN